MINQILIILILYILGFGFILLFYPKIHYSLCITSALFWGALIYIFSAVLLSFFRLYTGYIWVLLSIELIFFIIMVLRRKTIIKLIPLRKAIIWFVVLLCLFGVIFLIAENKLTLLTPDSKVYIVQGKRIFRSGSIMNPDEGLFYRELYGISEALMHSLAGFLSEPVFILWHPYLWITLFGSFFAILFEFSKQNFTNKLTSALVSLIMTIWVGTAGLNWVNGSYINVHLITAASIFFVFYSFGKMIYSDLEELEYGFLGGFALCLFGLSRVESPIMIVLILVMLLGAKVYSRKEILVTFLPPILLEILWLSFLLLRYLGFESFFWSDSRIILALGAYILLLIFLILHLFKKNLQHLARNNFVNIVLVVVINISLILLISEPDNQATNAFVILSQLFHLEIWGYYWWENFLILIIIIFSNNYFKKYHRPQKTKGLFIKYIFIYLFLILDLGFFRKVYSVVWTDSAARMFSHISPIIGYYICESVSLYLSRLNIFPKSAE